MGRQKLTIPRKSFGFRLDSELIKQLKIAALNEDRAANELLEEGIREVLKKYQKKPNRHL